MNLWWIICSKLVYERVPGDKDMKSLYDKMVTSEDGKIGLDSISLLVEAILLDDLIVDNSLLSVQESL